MIDKVEGSCVYLFLIHHVLLLSLDVTCLVNLIFHIPRCFYVLTTCVYDSEQAEVMFCLFSNFM